jgi:DHA1 family bicyclomycin/chloramphenicol resistance-like MFS transporter
MSKARTATIGALIVALGPVSLAIYTPALPTLVHVFDTSPATIKLTLSIYFCGFAFAQLVCGPLSDAFGRRPAAIGFFSIYVLGSLLAMMATGVGGLLAGRALQGIGVSAGVGISRAIVRDQFTGQDSARIMNLIGIMLGVGPAIAPSLGGILLTTFGWHALFVAMLIYGLVAVAVLVTALKETNPAPDRTRAHPSQMLRSYLIILSSRAFLRAGLILGSVVGGFYAVAVLLPFILIESVGLSPSQFGALLLISTGCYTLGGVVNSQIMRRYDSMTCVPIGLACVFISALGYGIGLRVFPPSMASVMIPAGFWAIGVSMVMAAMTTSALAEFREMAGAAAALVGFLQIGGGLAGSAVAALAFSDPVTAVTYLMPAMAIIGIVAYFGFAPSRRNPIIRDAES